VAARGRFAGPALAGALLLRLATACAPDAPESHDLPSEWYEAAVDPARGGRYLPAAHRALRAFQAEVLASGVPLPYPHYEPSRTIVLAIKSDFIDHGTGRRVGILLDHEASDPGLSVVAITDRPPAEIAAALGREAARRIALHRVSGDATAHVTFQFLRDYAPVVRALPGPDGWRTQSLVLFQGSTLNKVVDPGLGVRINRSAKTTRDKYELSRQLAALYAERLDRPIPILETDLRMDGGNVVTDGRGTCFSTRILVAKNGGDRTRVERALREDLGCQRSVFLAAPQRLDFIQHVDTLLYFADAENAVLSMPTLYESDKIREFQNVRTLLELGYEVHRIPRPTASITYTNILTTRDNVYVPQYTMYKIESREQAAINARVDALDRDQQRDLAAWYLSQPVKTERVRGGEQLAADNRRALEVIGRLFPERTVVPVDSDETLDTQGSWHCLSHELPESLVRASGPARPGR
jgi:agmatine/peptidylarginine deiminase